MPWSGNPRAALADGSTLYSLDCWRMIQLEVMVMKALDWRIPMAGHVYQQFAHALFAVANELVPPQQQHNAPDVLPDFE